MIQKDQKLNQLIQVVEQNGVYVDKEVRNHDLSDSDVMFPYLVIILCLRGSACISFDMHEFEIEKNDFGILMPGHFLRRVSSSEDYAYACVLISMEMLNEMRANAFSHNSDRYNYAPKCHLTDVQAKRVMELMELLEAIALHDSSDLKLRRQMLVSHLAVSYEFINYYRREQDRQWSESRPATLYTQFCDLVVEHYKKSRNVNYYARLLNYDARYFSKVFRQFSGGRSPLKWIQQYVAEQAKRIIDTNPEQTIKETAFQLGFPSTANFCRYFKRATGIYPQEYKSSHV